jgi:hypothetical protein
MLHTSDRVRNPGFVSGPNGPALITANLDAKHLWENDRILAHRVKHLLKDFNPLAYELFMRYRTLKVKLPNKQLHSGRLSYLQEGGGKTRVIAIADY